MLEKAKAARHVWCDECRMENRLPGYEVEAFRQAMKACAATMRATKWQLQTGTFVSGSRVPGIDGMRSLTRRWWVGANEQCCDETTNAEKLVFHTSRPCPRVTYPFSPSTLVRALPEDWYRLPHPVHGMLHAKCARKRLSRKPWSSPPAKSALVRFVQYMARRPIRHGH